MNKNYEITITNGTGSEEVLNGTYTVSATSAGYDSTTTDPTQITITNDSDEVDIKIGATGTLTLHVTEEGTEDGTPIVGATFQRTDSEGNTYGNAVTTDETGNATLEYLPFGTNSPTVYYKQLTSDGEHDFDNTNKSITLTTESTTQEVQNTAAKTITFNLTDKNYEGLIVDSGTINLTE